MLMRERKIILFLHQFHQKSSFNRYPAAILKLQNAIKKLPWLINFDLSHYLYFQIAYSSYHGQYNTITAKLKKEKGKYPSSLAILCFRFCASPKCLSLILSLSLVIFHHFRAFFQNPKHLRNYIYILERSPRFARKAQKYVLASSSSSASFSSSSSSAFSSSST